MGNKKTRGFTKDVLSRAADTNMEALVIAAKHGDEQAFRELMNMHKTRLYRIAWTYLRNEADALEAVQEAVYRAFVKLKKLREPKYFTSWIIRILMNVCTDEIKRQARSRANTALLEHSPQHHILHSASLPEVSIEDKLMLEMMVDNLNEREKQTIILKYYEGMTINEIARVLMCPPGTVKTRLHRALQSLRKMMKKGEHSHD